MKINYLFFLTLFTFFLIVNSANSQNKFKNMNIIVVKNSESDVRSDKESVGIARPKKHFEKPNYAISMMGSKCQFDIWIDDILAYNNRGTDFSDAGQAGNVPINHLILKTGVHTVTGRIYPLPGKKSLEYMSTLDLGLIMSDNDNFKDFERDIFEISAADLVPGKKGLAGLPYYEFNEKFFAEVPFNIEGWSRSINLTKYDQQKLAAEINVVYNNIYQILSQKDITKFKELYSKMLDNRSIQYYSDSEPTSSISSIADILNDPSYKLEPLPDNVYLHFMNDGRLVTLLSSYNNSIIRFVNKKDPTDEISLEFKFHKKTENSPLSVI